MCHIEIHVKILPEEPSPFGGLWVGGEGGIPEGKGYYAISFITYRISCQGLGSEC